MTVREAEKQQYEVPETRMNDEKEDNDGDGEDESAEQILERKREQVNPRYPFGIIGIIGPLFWWIGGKLIKPKIIMLK